MARNASHAQAGVPRRLVLKTIAFASAGPLLASCGGGEKDSKLRVVNALTSQSQLDIYDDDDLLFGGVAVGAVTDTKKIDGDRVDLNIRISGSAVNALEREISLSEDKQATVIVTGADTSINLISFIENESEPDSGHGKVRLVNSLQSGDALDLYITSGADDLSTQIPVLSNVARNATSAFRSLSKGTYRLRLTKSGDRSEVRLDVPAFVVGDKQVITVVAMPTSSGALVNGMALVQNGGATSFANEYGRLRFVNAASASVGASVEADGSSKPMVGGWGVSSYAAVRSGTRTVTFNVNGQTVSSQIDVAAGTDRTVAVYLEGGQLAVLSAPDNNQPPGSSDRFKMRLANVTEAAGSVQLTYNSGTVLADFTSSAQFSDYRDGTAGTYDFRATAGTSSSLLEDVAVAASAVYTAFVFGSGGIQSFVITRDR